MTAAIGNIDDAILSLSISVRFLNEVIMKIARPVVLGAALALAAFDQAPAQDWPTRSVTVVVPIPAGVASDIIARAVFEQVGKQVGQTFVIENRPGAGGTIGANMAPRPSPPRHCESETAPHRGWQKIEELAGAVQRVPVPRLSEYPALRRGHWTMGRPSVRYECSSSGHRGQPVGESSHVSCRPKTVRSSSR